MQDCTKKYEEAAARGATWMHENRPGWWSTHADCPISLATFDLRFPEKCVLGQVCPLEWMDHWMDSGYEAFLIQHGFNCHWASEHGFALLGTFSLEAWAALTDAWRTIIEKLRADAGELA